MGSSLGVNMKEDAGNCNIERPSLSEEMMGEMDNLTARLERLHGQTEEKLDTIYLAVPDVSSDAKTVAPEYPALFDNMRRMIGQCNRSINKIEGILGLVEL